MKNLFLLSFILFLFTSITVQAQVKLALIDNKYAERYEVYAMHEDFEFSSSTTHIGTGQVTLVVETGNELTKLTNYNGTWVMNATAEAPTENPTKDYISFGFSDYTQVDVSGSAPTLLFSVEYTSGGESNIIENDDPFLQLPNSLGTNPGNELSIANFENDMEMLRYSSTYEPCNPSPLPCELNDMNMAKINAKKKANKAVANMKDNGTIMAAKTRTITP